MPFHASRPALLCAAALLFPVAAYAEEDAADPVIIVIGQQQRPIEIAPRGLSVSLGEDQFAGISATNTEDLMKYAPNFFVRTRFAGDSNGVPGFRGTHSTQSARALVMVDGFTVSNFLGNSFGFAPKWGVVGPGEVRQLDIVYGPYSARYAGNSMGGIVNITTRDPERTEAFARVQLLSQPYSQFGTQDTYWGWSGEAGMGFRQKDGPWSLRLSGRHFRNDGHPQMFYGLTRGATGTPVPVTGAIVDPANASLTLVPAGAAVPTVPGSARNPFFAAQSPAAITQDQAKVKLGYDDGAVTGQILFAYWRNEDSQTAPDCYLRDAAGQPVCDGAVSIGGQSYTASGANFAKVLRDEYLLGGKAAAPLGDWTARLSLSTYQIARSDSYTSRGYAAGQSNGAGTLSSAGPTGWVTGDMSAERTGGPVDVALGLSGNAYRTANTTSSLPHWQDEAGALFGAETFGRTRTLAAWGEAVAHVSDAASITLGLRYEDWRAYDGGIRNAARTNLYIARRDDALSPKLTGQVELAGSTRIQLSLATATRFPTVGELFQGSLDGNGQLNPDSFDPSLKPERSLDANFLIARRFGPVALTGSAFYQRVTDTIFQFFGFNQNGVSVSNYKNIDLTRQYGFEGILEAQDWPLPGMTLEANAAWIDSRTLRNAANPAAEGEMFPRIPRWRVNGNVRQDFGSGVQGSIGLRYASRPNTDLFGLQRGDTYGYTSEMLAVDVKANWQASDALRLSAGVNNIANDRAWVFHPYPQRSFLLEAEWKL
ncbi:MAG: TonB-dependent receptor [Sphingobium sp.]